MMAVHFPRLSTPLQIVALIILISLSGTWNPGSTRTVQRSVIHKALSGLPPEAQHAISHLLDRADHDSAYSLVIDQWIEQGKFTASDGAAHDWFGRSVALSGETVVAGAFANAIGANVVQGSAYMFYNDTRLRLHFPLIGR